MARTEEQGAADCQWEGQCGAAQSFGGYVGDAQHVSGVAAVHTGAVMVVLTCAGNPGLSGNPDLLGGTALEEWELALYIVILFLVLFSG